jgi:hypothetical protein
MTILALSRMTRKRTKKTGSDLAGGIGRPLAAALLLLWLFAAPSAGVARDRNLETSYAVVAGTVFRESGLSLPGAEVELSADSQAQKSHKQKKAKLITDARGEFAFRVPSVAGNYKLTVRAAGYQVQEKPVSVAGDERVDVFFRLEPASK